MTNVATKALDLLAILAAKVGTTVEKLYPVLVRQAYIESLTYLVVWSGVAVIVAVVANYVRGLGRVDRDYYVGAWVLSGATLLFLAGALMANLPGLLNPEYYAVKELLQLVRPAK